MCRFMLYKPKEEGITPKTFVSRASTCAYTSIAGLALEHVNGALSVTCCVTRRRRGFCLQSHVSDHARILGLAPWHSGTQTLNGQVRVG